MSRNYCFTLNNPTLEEQAHLCEMHEGTEDLQFLVLQTERGRGTSSQSQNEDTSSTHQGTVHIQGYVELKKTMRHPAVKNLLGSRRYHLESRRGTQEGAIAYCEKEDTRIEGLRLKIGTPSVQGRRIDLETIRLGIIGGLSELQVADLYFGPWCRNYRALAKYRLMYNARHAQQSRQRTAPVVEILWGPTGTGKSRQVFETYPNSYWVARGDGVAYFDGVEETTEVIVFDDFYSWTRYDLVLRLCDRYPLLLKVHGGFVQCPSIKRVVFTSNADPRTWWHSYERMGGWEGSAFKRRVVEGGCMIVHKENFF